MDNQIRQRLVWVEMYAECGDAGLVCRRCGISRPTLRKWSRRYAAQGVEGLIEQSRRPHSSPNTKIGDKEEKWILDLRKTRKLGARRIKNELFRQHQCSLTLATIHKVLTRNDVKPFKRRKKKSEYIRYERPVPGDRVQMDTTKIAPGIIQYTAVDDCSRFRVLAVFSRRTGANTLLFLDQVVEEMPFPIQRIQTDRGREFFAVKVQEKMMEYGIKFRPNKPASPHLNGKVERSQRTDKEEFYSTADLNLNTLTDEIAEWQFYYNWQRTHGSLNGMTPIEKVVQLGDKTPYHQEVGDAYIVENERIKDANYQVDLKLRELKGCV